jgi:hypothetical protein
VLDLLMLTLSLGASAGAVGYIRAHQALTNPARMWGEAP